MARFVKSTVNRKKDFRNNVVEKYDSFHNAIRGGKCCGFVVFMFNLLFWTVTDGSYIGTDDRK